MQSHKCFVWTLAFALMLASTRLFAQFAPGTDQFAAAPVITFITGSSEPTDLTSFGFEPSEPVHHSGVGGPHQTAWWRWTATFPGFCTLDTLLSAVLPNDAKNTAIAVYTGTSLGSLVPVVRNDNALDSGLSKVTFFAQPGVTYSIAVDCTPESTGAVCLRLRQLVLVDGEWSGVLQPAPDSGAFPGAIDIKSTRAGLLTGSLSLGGKKYPFKGAWGLDGYFRTTFPQLAKTGMPTAPPIDLLIDGAETAIGLLVRVNDRNEGISGPAPRVSTFTPQQPAAERGTYNLTILDTPGIGAGGLRFSISPTGRLKGAGFLGDGQTVLFSSRLTEPFLFDAVPQAGLHIPLFAGGGFLNGYLCCTPSDARSAQMNYRRAANASSSFYTTGFQMSVNAYGSLYTRPAPQQRVLGLLDPSGGGKLHAGSTLGEVTEFTEALTLGANNKIAFGNSSFRRPKIKIDPATGLITGSFIEPTGTARKLRGIVARVGPEAVAFGYYTGRTATGWFGIVSPQP